MKKFLSENRNNPWFWAFVAIAAILLFVMPIMSKSAGNSGDEDGFQIPQGNFVLNYYKTDGADTTCLQDMVEIDGNKQGWNLKYYGCSFDVLTAWFNDTFGIDDIAKSRHIFNSLCGWLIVLFGGLIAWRIGGWKAGVFTLLLMFLSPRLLGHSFNNPKDIPFAAGVIMSIYYMIMFFRQTPKPKWYIMVMLALSIAFAISIRVGGLILLGYFGFFGLLWLIKTVRENKKAAPAKGKGSAPSPSNVIFKTILWAALVSIVGYFAGLLIWPYAWQAPIDNVKESYGAMSQFAIAIRQIFEGQMYWSDVLPWYYTPKFILMTIPIAVILGFLLFPFFGAFKKETRLESIMVLFTFLFPVFWIVYTGANVYGGWRHSLFAYPSMVVAAGLGFATLADFLKNKFGKGLAIAGNVLPFVLLITPFIHVVKNHPYEYVYFNEFVGGPKNAFGNYEMDYYYHSVREASEWVMANAEPSAEKIQVGSWHVNSTKYFLRTDTVHFRPRFVRWYRRGEFDWDYAVFAVTGIAPEYLRNPNVFPPKNTVHTVDVDGVPIAVVLKRDNKYDFEATKLKKAGQLDSAKALYFKSLENDPLDETALINLAEIYLNQQKPDSCLMMTGKYLNDIEATNDEARYFSAYAYLMQGNAQKAIDLTNEIINHNYKYGGAYQLQLQMYLQQNNLFYAEETMKKMIDVDLVDNNFVATWVSINKAQGLDERGTYIKLYKALVDSYKKRGKKKEAEMYQEQLDRIQ
ncbi:MAG: hypothetical protein J5605_02440 [Bacteroidales bacterium]|nr:hypothetical protein [Bacteroidales bacterium]